MRRPIATRGGRTVEGRKGGKGGGRSATAGRVVDRVT